jgi:hypothetical protein
MGVLVAVVGKEAGDPPGRRGRKIRAFVGVDAGIA